MITLLFFFESSWFKTPMSFIKNKINKKNTRKYTCASLAVLCEQRLNVVNVSRETRIPVPTLYSF